MDGTSGAEKHIDGVRVRRAAGAGARSGSSGVASTASANTAGGWPPSSADSASQISSIDDDATQCVASPRATTSAASKRAPVKAAYSPARPGQEASAREAPTSGNRPMATSGLCANQPVSREPPRHLIFMHRRALQPSLFRRNTVLPVDAEPHAANVNPSQKLH